MSRFVDWKAVQLCRAKGAEDYSPGQRPGYDAHASLSALKGRRIPAPLQGAPQLRERETQGVALG